MPNKKKKYNARFPPARIKKIMQTDDEVGKVAAAVPVIISRALELFVEALVVKTSEVTKGKNAKTLTSSHLKQCIQTISQFDFLKDLVANVPDVQGEEDSNSTSSESKPKLPRIKKPLRKEAKKHKASTSKEDEDSITESSELDEATDESDDEEVPYNTSMTTAGNNNISNARNQMQINSFPHYPNFYQVPDNNVDEDYDV